MAINDPLLLEEIDYLIKDMHTYEQDLMISVYGREGSGKSRFSLNLAKYVDKTFDAKTLKEKTAQTVEDFGRVAPHAPPYTVVWWDEAHRFAKRGTYTEDVNRDLLEYFQDIRGGRKIFILCYPDIDEIDRKVVKRSRMFFETTKNGREFWVRSWTQHQIILKLRELRLPSPKTRAKLWAGTPKKPIRVFNHDSKGIEAEIEAYKMMKAGSLRLSDMKLNEKYGYRNATHLANAVFQELDKIGLGDYSLSHLQYVSIKKIESVKDEWEIPKVGRIYRIYDTDVFNKLVSSIVGDIEELNSIKTIGMRQQLKQYNNKEGEKIDGKNQLLAEPQV